MEDYKYATEVVPEMTHPYGKVWDQPDRSKILIGEKYAIMTTQTMKELADYSMSQPTGVYEGKMWRSRGFKERKSGLEPIVWFDWYLHWFSESNDPNKCKYNRRNILLI